MQSQFDAILATATAQQRVGNLARAAEVREQALLLLVNGRLTHESKFSTFISETLTAQRSGNDLALLTRTVTALRPVATEHHTWFGEYQLCESLVRLNARAWADASLFGTTAKGAPRLTLKASQITTYLGYVANFVYSEWISVASKLSTEALDLAELAHTYIAGHAPTRNALQTGILELLREILVWHNRLPSVTDLHPLVPSAEDCAALLGEYFGPRHFTQRLRACILADYRAQGKSSKDLLTNYRDSVHAILRQPHYAHDVKRVLALAFYCDMLWLAQVSGGTKEPRAFLRSSVIARHVTAAERAALQSACESLLVPQSVLAQMPTQQCREWSVSAVQLLGRIAHSALKIGSADDVLRDIPVLRQHLALCGIDHPTLAVVAHFDAAAEIIKHRGRGQSSLLVAEAMLPSAPQLLRADLRSAHAWLVEFANGRAYRDDSADLGAWPRYALDAMGFASSPESLMPRPADDDVAGEDPADMAAERLTWLQDAYGRVAESLGDKNVFSIQLNLMLLEARCLVTHSVNKPLADDILNICNDLMKVSHLYLRQATRLREMQIDVLELLGDYSWAARICNYVRSLKAHHSGPEIANERAELVRREIRNLGRAGDHAAILACWQDFHNLLPAGRPGLQTILYVTSAAQAQGENDLALNFMSRVDQDSLDPADAVNLSLRKALVFESMEDFERAGHAYGVALSSMEMHADEFDNHHVSQVRRQQQRCIALTPPVTAE